MGAVDDLVRLSRTSDPDAVATSLDALRRAGDDQSLVKALQRIVKDGPSEAARIAAREIVLDASTRTTAKANLRFLEHAGDVLEPAVAAEAVRWLLATLTNPTAFQTRTSTAHLLDFRFVETLAGVVGAAGHNAQRDVIEFVLGLPSQTDQVNATAWATLLDRLPEAAWTNEDADRLVERSSTDGFPLAGTLLGLASSLGSEDARARLVAEMADGSFDALTNAGDVRQLDASVVSKQIGVLGSSLKKAIADARNGTHGIGGDTGRTLVLLNLWHPTLADWNVVLELLRENAVAIEQKRGALILMAQMVDRIPLAIRDDLATTTLELARYNGPVVSFLGSHEMDARAEAALLATALGAFDPDEAAQTTLALLEGRRADRFWAATIAGRGDHPLYPGLLLALCTDSDPDVRSAACAGLVRAASTDLNPLIEAGLRKCSVDPGRQVARQLAYSLATMDQPTNRAAGLNAELAEVLKTNPSAVVRRTITDVNTEPR